MYLLTREDFKGLGNGIGEIKLLLEKFRNDKRLHRSQESLKRNLNREKSLIERNKDKIINR